MKKRSIITPISFTSNFWAKYSGSSAKKARKTKKTVNFCSRFHILNGVFFSRVRNIINIRIDDELVGIPNFNSGGQQNYESIVFTSNDLEYGQHTLEIECLGQGSIIFGGVYVDPLPREGSYCLGFSDFKEREGDWIEYSDTPRVFSSSSEKASGTFEFYGTKFYLNKI